MTDAHGLRVVGGQWTMRRLVDWPSAFLAYCALDPRIDPDDEAYLSHFTFGADFRSYFTAQNNSERGYDGLCCAHWLFMDIDRPDLRVAHADAKRLTSNLLHQAAELEYDDLLIFLSGNKGFHVGLPVTLWGPEPSERFHHVAKAFCASIAERAGVAIDPMVYSKVRLLRAPNSRHPKTGIYKRKYSYDELMNLSTEAVVERAAAPVEFEPPAPSRFSPALANDWQAATEAVERRPRTPPPTHADGERRLSAFVRRFLHDGELDPDQRAVSTFRAAAELAEMERDHGSDALIHALLIETALDSGLSPTEARRQIACGIAHARKRKEGGGR